jgi:hypothetical protein
MTADQIDLLEADVDRRMRELTPDHYRKLGVRPPEPAELVVKVAEAPGDEQVQSMLGSLLSEAFLAANSAFQRARQSGEAVELRDIYLAQASKLARACAELSEAMANRRDRGRRFVRVEHVHVHAGGQAIVGAVTSPMGGR